MHHVHNFLLHTWEYSYVRERKSTHVKHQIFRSQCQGILLCNEVFAGEGIFLWRAGSAWQPWHCDSSQPVKRTVRAI